MAGPKTNAAWMLVPLLLGGCATHCHEEQIYRPAVLLAGDGTLDVMQTEVSVELASLSSIQVDECGWAYRDAAGHPVSLCLTIQVEDSHVLQLQPATVRVWSAEGKEHVLEIGKLRYEIWSLYNPDGSEEPDSSLKPPTEAPLEVRRGKRYGNGRTDGYAFDAGAPFEGASTTFSPVMARVLTQNARRRRYFASIKLPPDLEKQFSAELPDVSLDGKRYSLPRLEFRYSTESVCSFTP